MSLKIGLERLAFYNQWMNKNIYQVSKQLNKEQLSEDKGAYFGSIIGTLNHIVVGDIYWFKRFSKHPRLSKSLEYFQNHELPNSLRSIIHDELHKLWVKREEMDKIIVRFTSELSDEVLSESLTYQNSVGEESTRNIGWLLQHVFNHQTHHRGQVTTLLNQSGIEVGVTDMLACIPKEM